MAYMAAKRAEDIEDFEADLLDEGQAGTQRLVMIELQNSIDSPIRDIQGHPIQAAARETWGATRFHGLTVPQLLLIMQRERYIKRAILIQDVFFADRVPSLLNMELATQLSSRWSWEALESMSRLAG